MRVRMVTWNVAGRKKTLAVQVDYLAANKPSLVCLQEVTAGTVDALSEGLRAAGLVHVVHTISDDHPRQGPRRYGVLIASRDAITLVSNDGVPWPERLLGVRARVGAIDCTVLTTHIPPGSTNGWTKIDMLEAVVETAGSMTGNRIVCGDFNCPQEERPDGTVMTWGQRVRKNGSIRIRRGQERWDAGERGAIEGLPSIGLVDVPRFIHGTQARLYSYFDIRQGTVRASRRYDHVFASEPLNAVWSQYDDQPRQAGFSDHAALLVDFELF